MTTTNIIKHVERALVLMNKLPDDYKDSSNYRHCYNILAESVGLLQKLKIKKPKRFYGNW